MDRALKVLNIDDVIEINYNLITQTGGVFFTGDMNLANPGSLEHVLEEIQVSVFGFQPYPSLVEKAALVAWRIIASHVFHDGNKRTGMEACRQFLEMNGHTMRIEREGIDQELIDMALRIATHRVEFAEFVQWVKQRTAPSMV
jgi:death-on-curing protein